MAQLDNIPIGVASSNRRGASDGKEIPLQIDSSEVRSTTAAATFRHKMPILADSGYEGAGQGVLTPVKKPKNGRDLDIDTRTYNALLRSIRCLGE
jgi:hypothetical protein